MGTFDYICLSFALCTAVIAVCSVFYYRRKTKSTLKCASKMIDDAILGNFSESVFDESLLSSVESKLAQYLNSCSVSSKNLSAEKDKIKELIADISHQTKTPVSNILLYTQLLGEQDLSEESSQYVSNLSEQAQKLSFLIESLVKVSRLETGIISLNPKQSDVASLLSTVTSQISPKAKAKNITVKVCETTEKACFDPKWTAEAVYNILDNAVKYTPCGGSIEISATAFELFCRIDIKDNGIGISEDEHTKIFSRFYRSPKVAESEGVGIGLYLAREIVSGEGGYIRVSSVKDEGSVFSIHLPREA
ncbi:MAG: two-component sensor histidine kinase [Firmicutes bacterium HGW-Firmicutes-16]|nr:MAG: two-component sensor histidine kinase [Firmicutes bacterium HGW-Firmicutes-16]